MSDKKRLPWFDSKFKDAENNFTDFLNLRTNLKPKIDAAKTVLIYIFLSCVWILLTEAIVSRRPPGSSRLYLMLLYVFVSAAALYAAFHNKISLLKTAAFKVSQSIEDLKNTYKELISLEENISKSYRDLEEKQKALISSESRYNLAVEGSNDGIWDWNLESGYFFFSIKRKSVLGYEENELENTFDGWLSILHPDDRERCRKLMVDYLSSKKNFTFEDTIRVRCKNGNYRWILSKGKGVWDKDGNPLRIAGSHTDITDKMFLEESLRQERELSGNIIKEAPVLIIVTDKSAKIIDFNPYAEKTTGYQKNEVIGKRIEFLLLSVTKSKRIKQFLERIINGEEIRNIEIEILSKDENISTIIWSNIVLTDEQGDMQELVFIGTDITQRIRMEKKLHILAYYDSLTQLPNRALFEEEVDRQIYNSTEKNSKFALMYLDIDNFKNINDTMGHGAGDCLIVYIAKLLSQTVRFPDMVARLGGDEFAIIMVNIKNSNDIIARTKNLLAHLKKPWVFHGYEFFISASIGIAMFPEHGENLESLVQNADTALFHIKEHGKNGYCIYNSAMREKAWKYIKMNNQLISGIKNNEFLLYYQPQIDLASKKVVGVEALIRWQHPQKGLILPKDFIPFAEQSGHILQIGNWVLKTACKQKMDWQAKGIDNIKVSVNISIKNLMQKSFASDIKRILQENGIDANFELEITETALIDELDKIIPIMHRLKDLSITIALDDFGTGFSSLTHLQKLPIDILKVDKSFIKNVRADNEDYFILKSIVELAHNLGLKVVAEGVETKQQLNFLIKNKCDIAQGYYLGEPKTASEMESILIKNSPCIMDSL